MNNSLKVKTMTMHRKKIAILFFGFLIACVGLSQELKAQTSSPFPPPEEKLGVYVINSGPGLDTGCTFRGDGPLVIQLFVPAIVNPNQLNPDGTLKNDSNVVNNGVLGTQGMQKTKAILRFPVYDIDSGANMSPPYRPEKDNISFNGQFLKVLSGINNQWTDDSIVIPIEEVKFGANNEIRVDIDTENSAELWCMAVDWVSIEFDVAAPYVLAHGIAAEKDTWNEENSPGVLQTLDDSGVLYTMFTVPA